MSDFQNAKRFTQVTAASKSADFESGAPIELTIGACARIARTHRDQIDAAMKSGELPYTRDHDNRRVTTWDALTTWMRRQPTSALAAE